MAPRTTICSGKAKSPDEEKGRQLRQCCLPHPQGEKSTTLLKDRWMRYRTAKLYTQSLGGEMSTPVGLSPLPTVRSQPASPPPGGAQSLPHPTPKGTIQPSSRERGRCACRETSPERALRVGRPSADVRAIIIISPPPDGMVRVAPSSACQAPSPRSPGTGAKDPSLRAACLFSSGAPGPASARAWPPARAAFLQVQGPKWLSASGSSAGHLRRAEALAGVAQHS